MLLPPSESKAAPEAGPTLSLADRPDELRATTELVLDALIDVCDSDPARARRLLKLSPGQADLVTLNARLRQAPTAPAWKIYNGVLYDALDFGSLTTRGRRRGRSDVLVASGLFGLVGLSERIPAYRLSASAGPLPGMAPLRELWSAPLTSYISRLAPSIILDLRSSAYVSLWPIPESLTKRTVTVKIWQGVPGGERTAVSHHNKAYKGRLLRSLLEADRLPRSPTGLVAELDRAGWTVALEGSRLDVIVEP
ncbi:MAG: peroxide stress protein YaaA [Actinobacteria bacterium]|nr:peroxide stress protein YaaA [Actinomycetota bacterium]